MTSPIYKSIFAASIHRFLLFSTFVASDYIVENFDSAFWTWRYHTSRFRGKELTW